MKCAVCGKEGTVVRVGKNVMAVLLWKVEDAFLCEKCWEHRFGGDAPGLADLRRACERMEFLCDRNLLFVKLGNGSRPKV